MASENKFIAFDLGAHTVSAAVFARGRGDQLVLERYAKTQLLADPAADGTRLDQLKQAMSALAKELKIGGQSIRFAVSSQSVFTRFVKLPPLEVDQLDQIVGFEAQQQVPFPLEQAVWDYQTLGSPDDIEVEVVLVAMKADDLGQLNDVVRSAGLDTATVDLAPMALFNAFRYNYPDIEVPVVLIDVGARTTNLIYVEGHKVFVRSIQGGGRDTTMAIAKEFDLSFQDAEERKIHDGFVALGGGFADHENPEIAAMSKVIRQASTRLHAEIVRTNNFYRSNQGGSAPAMAFLCGAGSSLPYLNEFFQEKLKIPVQYFNCFRNVQIGNKVPREEINHSSHSIGELIGLGLRGLGNCPMEIDLVPRVIQAERDLAGRKPFLWLAGLSAALTLGALGFFFQAAAGYATKQEEQLSSEVTKLQGFSADIKELHGRLSQIQLRADPYSQAVGDRIYWITTLKELNEKLTNDLIWIVELQPISKEQTLMAEAGNDSLTTLTGVPTTSAAVGDHVVDRIQVIGLWRGGDTNPDGSKVVYDYLDRLVQSDSYTFDLVQRDEVTNEVKLDENGKKIPKFAPDELIKNVDHGVGAKSYAFQFTMYLPLPPGRQIKFVK